MEEIKLLIQITKELGVKTSVIILTLWVIYKETKTFIRKKNGDYISFKKINDISQKLDRHIMDTKERIDILKHDSQGILIMIEKSESKIDTLRIVSEKTSELVNESIREIKEDMRQIKNYLLRDKNQL